MLQGSRLCSATVLTRAREQATCACAGACAIFSCESACTARPYCAWKVTKGKGACKNVNAKYKEVAVNKPCPVPPLNANDAKAWAAFCKAAKCSTWKVRSFGCGIA